MKRVSSLPDDTCLGSVRLRVSDLERQVGFYRDVLGLRLLAAEGGSVSLGAGDDGAALLVLDEAPGAPAPPPRSPGLYHVAYLLPRRSDLAAAVVGLRARGWRFDGFADHAVSEAAYLSDPEGNGIELYADRPREDWRVVGGETYMTTAPLDLGGLLAEALGAGERLPVETVVGHVHLKTSSLAAAEAFYVGRLGFAVTTRTYPGALFVAAGGYHHHVGLNVWTSREAAPPPQGSRGLVSFELVVPDAGTRRRFLDGADEGSLAGPDGEVVRVVVRA